MVYHNLAERNIDINLGCLATVFQPRISFTTVDVIETVFCLLFVYKRGEGA